MTSEERDPFRPKTLNEFIGQDHLKQKLQVYIDSAHVLGKPLDHVLLTTFPGMGKTALAGLIVDAVGDPGYSMDLSAIPPNKLGLILRRIDGGIIIMDELHRASRAQQQAILTLLEERYIILPSGARYEIPHLTIIGMTTDPERIIEPLRERYPIQPEFDPYSEGDMTRIIEQMCRSCVLPAVEDLLGGMAHACVGTPRLARDMVQAYRALHSSQRTTTLDSVLDLCGLDRNGLMAKHYEYLRALDRLGGEAGEKPLMNVLRIKSSSTLQDLERVLFQRDMISFGKQGRYILGAGEALIRQERSYKRERLTPL